MRFPCVVHATCAMGRTVGYTFVQLIDVCFLPQNRAALLASSIEVYAVLGGGDSCMDLLRYKSKAT